MGGANAIESDRLGYQIGIELQDSRDFLGFEKHRGFNPVYFTIDELLSLQSFQKTMHFAEGSAAADVMIQLIRK